MKRYIKSLIILIVLILVIWALFFVFKKTFKNNSISCRDCNLIMIALTNISAEHMSSYGYFRETTPEIDKFAKEAILFENAFAHTSWTLPSATSLFTSQYPYAHGIFDRSRSKEIEGTTLAEILKLNGFKTAAFTGGGDYQKIYGLNKGFDKYIASDYFVHLKDRMPLVFNWLEENSKDKFFLYFQGFDTHCPFNPPMPYEELFTEKIDKENIKVDRNFCLRGFKNVSADEDIYRSYYFQQNDEIPVDLDQNDIDYLVSQYDGEIRMTDDSVDQFLNYLRDKDLLKKSIVIIFSEHGEMFGKHGRFGRAGSNRGTLYDEVIHVPLIIKHPKIKEPQRINGLVQLIDIMPTILDFLEIPQLEQNQGKSLFPLIFNNQEVNEYIYAGAKFGHLNFDFFNVLSVNEMIRNKEWKLMREVIYGEKSKETWELYNIVDDAHESNNLASLKPDLVDRLKKKLSIWASSIQGNSEDKYSPVPQEIIEEAKKRGYW